MRTPSFERVCNNAGVFAPADHEGRRAAIIPAALEILATAGSSALTVHRVSAAAGIPPSTYRYTYATQRAVKIDVLGAIAAAIRERARAAATPREALLDLLPLTPQRRNEVLVVHALSADALHDEEIRAAWRQVSDAMAEICEAAIKEGGGEVRPGDVQRLHSLVDGLNSRILLSSDPQSSEKARQLVAGALMATWRAIATPG